MVTPLLRWFGRPDMMQHPAPERPREIDPLAEAILTRLQPYPVARFIVLGGYFALKHYHDYHITHDVDAWWDEDSRESDREGVRAVLNAVIKPVADERGLTLKHRRFGDTESWELVMAGHLSPGECWDLWRRKNPDLDSADARLEVARHLHEIELRRPLETLTDPARREQARQTRDWFRAVLLRSSPT